MTKLIFHMGAFVAASTLGASLAFAHITLENRQAPVGATYKAVFRVPHGCAGSATVKVRVLIPDGVINAKPMPHAGWSLETVKGKYDATYDYFGTPMSEGVKEVIWTGKLPDENYDEFVINTYLTGGLKPDTTLYFPTVQECEVGADRWIEIPAEGKRADDYKRPAPGVKLLPKP